MEKKGVSRPFNPERYGMIYCPACKGSGNFFNGVGGRVVCGLCGGFGLIRKGEKNVHDDRVITQLRK